jgi:hypothetical protein
MLPGILPDATAFWVAESREFSYGRARMIQVVSVESTSPGGRLTPKLNIGQLLVRLAAALGSKQSKSARFLLVALNFTFIDGAIATGATAPVGNRPLSWVPRTFLGDPSGNVGGGSDALGAAGNDRASLGASDQESRHIAPCGMNAIQFACPRGQVGLKRISCTRRDVQKHSWDLNIWRRTKDHGTVARRF